MIPKDPRPTSSKKNTTGPVPADDEEVLRHGIDARYQDLFSTMGLGFCVIEMIYDERGDPCDHRFVDLNSAFAEHTGLHDAKGRTMRELAPGIEQFWFDTYGHVARTGEPATFVKEARALGRWFEVQAYRLSGGDEQVGVLFTDITARKRTEKNAAQLAAIVSTSHDAIISKDLNGIIQTWNNGAQALFGYSAEETIGRPTTMLMPPDRVNEEPGILLRIGRGELIDHYETIRQHKDGTLLDVSLTISPIRDAAGTIIGASKIARDISERKRKERNLAFLSIIHHALLQLRSRKELSEAIGRSISSHLGLAGCAFVDVTASLNEVVVNELWHQPDAPSIVGTYPLDDFISRGSGSTPCTNNGLVVADTAEDPRMTTTRLKDLGIGSIVAMPVVQEGDRRFALCAYHSAPHAWREDEVELMGELSRTIWTRLERLRSEILLRQSEERLQSALEAAELGTWNMDVDTGLFQSDERFKAIFGKTVEGLDTENALSDIHPDDHAKVTAAVAAAIRIEDPQPYVIEYRVVHADGSIHWVDVKGRASFEGEGAERKLIAFAGTVADITDRKTAEQAIRESEQRYTLLFSSMDQGFCVMQLHYDENDQPVDWTYLEVNPAFEKQSGLKNVAGKRASELLPDLEPHWYQTYGNVLRTRRAERYMNEVRELDKWMEVYAFPAGDPESRLLGVLFTDVTVRMRMENEMKRAAQVLQENDKRKNEFLAMLAHELRNPLASLRTGLEVLHEMSGHNGALLEVEGMMQRQMKQMVHLVDDLLDVSRVSTGKIILRKKRVELGQVLKEAQETVQAAVVDKGQRLMVHLPPGPVPMQADPTRLVQVFANLLNNASKFSDRGARIEVIAKVEDGRVCVAVRDEGVGLAAEDLTRIFDLFSQVDSSLARNTSGLGIGLTLVKDLVRLHDGTVEAHSEGLGHGSTITVCLPLPDEATAEAAVKKPLDKKKAANARKVLVIDDNRDAAQLLAMALSHHGHNVQIAHDGLEGLKLTESFRPQVVLLDIGLPGLNGYEVAKRIRKEPWGSEIFLVALTGWGQAEDHARSEDAGFDKHLVKPVQLSVIFDLLLELN